ncbi:Na+/H+ antiporter NhaC family protein [Neobacillus dielmonensis]|uniref:Na+/H+ antiporter NhaC family protein n=1 Tax=Neobacillus dielmonensis TaxID=1347369 RepID=UPI0005A7AB25|nr:Na+/H+ antiporter NhaC family protein [Neobacillus dielmonensis]
MEFSNFSIYQVLLLLLITLSGVVCSVVLGFPLVIGFSPGLFVLGWLAFTKGFSLKDIAFISLQGVNQAKIVLLILTLVSFLLPSWYLAGTINQMVDIALGLIAPKHFFVLSFLTAMFFSMLLGTTIGTLSSIAVPILGTAAVLGLPIQIAAGALVAGAFVGDRTSPFSSSHQLLAHTVEITVKKQGKAMLISTLTALFICICFYAGLDLFISKDAAEVGRHLEWTQLSPIKLLPPMILILFVVLRIRIVYAFLSSILSAAVLAFIEGTPILPIVNDLWKGIDGVGGGFIHMYELLLFLVAAGAYNGLLEKLYIIQPYLEKWLKSSKSLKGDTFKVLMAGGIISLIAANQTLPIILTGRSFLPHWSLRYGKEELARVLGDSVMLFPGMVPWSVLTIMCSTIVGIPISGYLPYALFLWILPFICLVYSTMIPLLKKKKSRLVA